MSRSVSAPSSVTKTSPCWNGDIVPGSTFRYGSNFCSWTRSPRAFSRRPSDAATIPLPSAETTPPVTKTYFGARALTGFQGSSGGGGTLAADGGEELAAAEHPLELRLPLLLAELLDARVRRLPRRLLDAEVAVGERRDLRQVRDRDHLRALGQPAEEPADGVRGLAADARVDLVEDERVAARDGGDRQRDPRQLASRCRLGHGRERQPGVRPDEERGLVDAGRARLALPQLADELAVAHADLPELRGDGVRERGRTGVPLRAQLKRERVDARLRDGDGRGGDGGGIAALPQRGELGVRLGSARQQLLVARAAEAPLRLGDPVELRLELLQASRLGLERGEEGLEVGRRLP